MAQKYTQEEFIEKVKLVNENVEILGFYEGCSKPILVKCKSCGKTWSPKAGHLLEGHGCQSCSNPRKLTHEEFIKRVKEDNPSIIVKGRFTSTRNRVEVECSICHNSWSPRASYLYGDGKRGCRECFNTKIRRSHDEFVLAVKRDNPSIIIKGEFSDSREHIDVECSVCHFTWSPRAGTLVGEYKHGCPNCGRIIANEKKTLTQEEFQKRINDINPHIEITNKFEGVSQKIESHCLICGHNWMPFASNLLQGAGCPKCALKKMSESKTISNDEFIRRVRELNPNIKVLDPYTGGTNMISVLCTSCNSTYKTVASYLLRGHGCKKCAALKLRKDNDTFISELKRINPDLIAIEPYQTAIIPVKLKCVKCSTEFSRTPNRLLTGNPQCPTCSMPKGEKRIAEYLDANQIKYEKGMEYDGLLGTGGGNLSYDFYIPSLHLLVEYHGIQHEKPVDFKGLGEKYAREAFEKQVEHDRRKGEYAKNHKIPLLVIWYKDFDNIETILTNYISKAA